MGSTQIRRPRFPFQLCQEHVVSSWASTIPCTADIKRTTDQPYGFPIVFLISSLQERSCAPSTVIQLSSKFLWVLSGTALAPGPSTVWGACAVVLAHHMPTLVTLDSAAPLEFAVTAADSLSSSLFHLQATFCAQAPTAALLPSGCVAAVLQTLPTFCAIDAQAGIAGTVIR